MLRAAALGDPGFWISAVATPARRGPVEEDLVALVVRTSKAGVTEDTRVVFLAGPAVPRDVARGKHMSTSSLVRFC